LGVIGKKISYLRKVIEPRIRVSWIEGEERGVSVSEDEIAVAKPRTGLFDQRKEAISAASQPSEFIYIATI
jgi:hypothetical protein